MVNSPFWPNQPKQRVITGRRIVTRRRRSSTTVSLSYEKRRAAITVRLVAVLLANPSIHCFDTVKARKSRTKAHSAAHAESLGIQHHLGAVTARAPLFSLSMSKAMYNVCFFIFFFFFS
jgi:hypothetical protein